jgi:hypothetical protein
MIPYNAGDSIDRSRQGYQAVKSVKDRRDGQSTPCRRSTMPPDFFRDNPFRRPMWRAERVFAMLEHRPRPLRPRRCDDTYVRAYRCFLKHCLAAGDDTAERLRLHPAMRNVDQAHRLRFDADEERREILQARLLTVETFTEIAARFATEAPVIDCFEKLFFNVRDRLTNKDWIAKIIKGPPENRVPSRDGVLTAAQRGFVYRLFAFFGGPVVLDTLIGCLSPHRMPQQVEDAWFDDATRDIVRSRAAMAASVFAIDGQNIMRVLKLALRTIPARSAVTAPNQMSATDRDTILRELERLTGTGVARAASSLTHPWDEQGYPGHAAQPNL